MTTNRIVAVERWRTLLFVVVLILAPVTCSADELFPAELTKFEPIASNPVFTAQGEGHRDVKLRERV